jgi:hypothetical protein
MASEAIIAQQIVDSTTDSRTIIVGSGLSFNNTDKQLTGGSFVATGIFDLNASASGTFIGKSVNTTLATVMLKAPAGSVTRLDDDGTTFRIIKNGILFTATDTRATFQKPLRFSNPSETADNSNTGVCQFSNTSLDQSLFSFRVNVARNFILDSSFGGNPTTTITVERSSRIVTFATGVGLAESANIIAGTTTGSKIGTATTQKLGFWNAAPAVQPAAVADATSEADAVTKLNDLLAKLRTIGIIGT